MRTAARVGGLLAVLAASCITAQPAWPAAQPGPPSRAQSDPKLLQVATALGMSRGVRRDMDSINTIQFSASGSAADPGPKGATRMVTRLVEGVSYYIPAARRDADVVGASGAKERRVEVVNKETAWNETAPGVGAIPVPAAEAAARLQRIWLTPHGAIRAVVDAEPSVVAWTLEGGKDVVTVKKDRFDIRAVLNADHRPERVEVRAPGVPAMSATYSGYKDWDGYDVYFPERIVEWVGTRQVLDITVTLFRNNPYVVFPIPKSLPAAK